MDQNEKVANDKISKLENEIKVLKNEVQAVLLDLRESYLNMENPFNSAANPADTQQIVITERAPAKGSGPENQMKDNPNLENDEVKKSPRTEKPQSAALETERNYSSEDTPFTDSDGEIARKEVKGLPVSYSKSGSRSVISSEPDSKKNVKLDLVTVAGLTGWAENSTKKLGRERTEAILDISEAMGYITADLKSILIRLISLAPQCSIESPTRTRDYIDSLIKLNSLLGKDNREEAALLLLSLMSGDASHG